MLSAITNKIKANKYIYIIALLGFLLRVFFYFFGAAMYYGKKSFYIGGDTDSFLVPIKNLIDFGTLSVDINNPKGAFGREPGYSFLLAPFYILFGNNTDLLCKAVCWFQIILDSLCIVLFYKVALTVFKNNKIAIVSAVLYAIYPFVIVWTSVVQAESIGVDVLILMMYYLSKQNISYRYFIVGGLVAIGFFIRPQLLFLLPAIGFSLIVFYKKNIKKWMKYGIHLAIGFLIVYSPWPIRNYVFHNQLELFRDISTMRPWQDDVQNFHEYIVSMQVDWEPQFTQIITSNDSVSFPQAAYTSKADSLKLIKAIALSRTCGDGFASFMRKPPIQENNCTKETGQLWKSLYENQVKYNPLNVFLWVPLKNLQKGIFKISLVKNWKSPALPAKTVFLVGILFSYRTFLILLGLIGCVFYFKQKNNALNIVMLCTLFYFIIWYFWMCFIYRALEMRYFLPADVLLLFPAAFVLHTFLNRFSLFKKYLA